jgi:hypothetical protein
MAERSVILCLTANMQNAFQTCPMLNVLIGMAKDGHFAPEGTPI